MASDKFVSRGGEKLQSAIVNFQLSIVNLICLDVGCSTGGFVDCLLQNGAAKVYALDTAYGELAWKLRNDPRVVVMERTNILHLTRLPSGHPERAKRVEGSLTNVSSNKLRDSSPAEPDQNDDIKVDLVTIDAGWTKLELILPIIRNFLKPDGVIVALLKPHYEGSKKDLVKGVLLPEIAERVKDEVLLKIKNLKLKIVGEMDSPILGGAGNKEYLLNISND